MYRVVVLAVNYRFMVRASACHPCCAWLCVDKRRGKGFRCEPCSQVLRLLKREVPGDHSVSSFDPVAHHWRTEDITVDDDGKCLADKRLREVREPFSIRR